MAVARWCCCAVLLAWQAASLFLQVDDTEDRLPSPATSTWPWDEWMDDLIFEGLPAVLKSASQDPRDIAVASGVLYPPAKLFFCRIPKIGDVQFSRLFNAMNGESHDYPDTHFEVSTPAWHGINPADVRRENGWKFAVFVRDPLMRYLSAWGSKCVQQEGNGTFCRPLGDVSNHTGGTEESVKDFEENVFANWAAVPRPPVDGHWKLQQNSCGGLNDAKDYDFVGNLRGDVHGQVVSMMQMVGAPVDLVEKFFPLQGVEGHQSRLDPELYYRNVTVKAMVKEMYAPDYRLPGMTTPSTV